MIPFVELTGINSCKCSLFLERKIVDLGAERSINKTVSAIEEHYGFILPSSAVRAHLYGAGDEAQAFNNKKIEEIQSKEILIVQIDGSMAPIVSYEKILEDGKRERDCVWKEFRLCCATDAETRKTRYGVIHGSPTASGEMMFQTAKASGLGLETQVHGVGDGALWIADQFEKQFGAQQSYLLDFFHVTEYLAAASKEFKTQGNKTPQKWYEEKKDQLKAGKYAEVIAELWGYAQTIKGESAMYKAYRYLNERRDQLDYDQAIEAKLPIGSGEVESGHRSVLQARLKKPGAWWKIENAEKVAQIKVMQANEEWEQYWDYRAAA